MSTVTATTTAAQAAGEFDLNGLTLVELRALWFQARAEVWRREGRRLDRRGFPVRDRRQDRDEQCVEATSDSLHPEGF